MAGGPGAFSTLEQRWWLEGGATAGVGESEAPSSSGAPWRIKSLFAGHGKDNVAIDLFFIFQL